jgi:N-methylhydantoinase A
MARNLLLVPAVEAISIGAGGGSIAWLDAANALHVGPRSQGARPGPACYGRGGTLPTVTDADVVLGYINPERFLGGGMRLSADLAHEAIREHIANPLGVSVEAAAQAIYDIVNAHMADLVRSVTVGRGFDPRDFAVVAFGGCGPTHCTGFGPDCQPRRIVVPPAATVLSALGIAQSDIKHFHTRTFVRHLESNPDAQAELLKELNGHFEELVAQTTAQFESEGIPSSQRTFVRSLDIRYRKQVHELTIPIRSSGRLDDAVLGAVVDDFVRTYERIYGAGSSIGKSGLELATLRVEGIAKIPRVQDALRSERGSPSPKLAWLGQRKVWWKEFGGFRDTDAFQLEKLVAGNIVEGPAAIESYGTSIPLHPGQRAQVDEWSNLVIDVSPAQKSARVQSARTGHRSDVMIGAHA